MAEPHPTQPGAASHDLPVSAALSAFIAEHWARATCPICAPSPPRPGPPAAGRPSPPATRASDW
ncbi:hypothetical protein GXW82_15830 [Streptacidiphilus sp. 4-A2]|nr:hypothetical protein [Streptacidiphilus sp. 4-A2]